MEKSINEKHIRTNFKYETENRIELGQEVKLDVVASCVKIETSDNQDGSVNEVYVLKPLSVDIG